MGGSGCLMPAINWVRAAVACEAGGNRKGSLAGGSSRAGAEVSIDLVLTLVMSSSPAR